MKKPPAFFFFPSSVNGLIECIDPACRAASNGAIRKQTLLAVSSQLYPRNEPPTKQASKGGSKDGAAQSEARGLFVPPSSASNSPLNAPCRANALDLAHHSSVHRKSGLDERMNAPSFLFLWIENRQNPPRSEAFFDIPVGDHLHLELAASSGRGLFSASVPCPREVPAPHTGLIWVTRRRLARAGKRHGW